MWTDYLRVRFFAALIALVSLSAGQPAFSAQVIHRFEKVSRDFTYVAFSRDASPYIHKGKVGGEHSTFIRVLGFEGDVFLVKMKKTGDAGYAVYGEGVQIERQGLWKRVCVKSESALFTVDISAMTYGEYRLLIEKKSD